ncbi:nucleotidyltransferase domain-containing protein [Streptomyces sp. NPDC127190]|uniref:nucleotidyltransferase domain-containing protein n=1 Tax=unclassified Streptomyces TaxID=2593676 RepID=UPI00362E97F4
MEIELLRLGLTHSLHAVDRERSARQLRLIGETVEIAQALGVEVWLRGGWAMDFFIGEVTRDHVDLDWFVWAKDASALTDGLLRSGYEPLSGPPADQQLDFRKEGVESSFALLGKNRCGQVVVAGGPWAGEAWPEGMLDAPVGRIGALRCRTISPRAQIEIKQMMPVWLPGRPRRAKDAEDIARLEAALREQGARPA